MTNKIKKHYNVGSANSHWKGGLPKCLDCGKLLSNYLAKRCFKCYLIWRALPNNHPSITHGKTLKYHYCPDCQKQLSDYRAKRCKSCTITNAFKIGKYKNRNQYKQNNPNWNGGSSFEPYSCEWTKELKYKIRKRDNYTCQNCGMTEEEHLIEVGAVLHIHHIDYNKKNCKENNLITLCFKCNLEANCNRDYYRKYYKNLLEKIYENIQR